jgi:hypothetical protein
MNAQHYITERVKNAASDAFADQSNAALLLLASAPVEDGEAAEIILLGLIKMAKGDLTRLKSSIDYYDPRDAMYAFQGVDWDEVLKDAKQ